MATPSINSGYIAGTWAGADKTSFEIGTPDHAPGDVIYIGFIIQALTTISIDDLDFTELFADQTIGVDSTFSLFYKIAGDSEPESYEITTGIAERGTWFAFSVFNDDGINTSVLSSSGTGTAVAQPSYTTTVDDCLVIFVIAARLDAGNMVEGIANKLDNVIGGSSAGSIGVFYLARPTAGAYSGGTVATMTNNRDRRIGAIAIAPGAFVPPAEPTADTSAQRIRTYLPG